MSCRCHADNICHAHRSWQKSVLTRSRQPSWAITGAPGNATAACSDCHSGRPSSAVIMIVLASCGTPVPKTPAAVSSVRTSGDTTISCRRTIKAHSEFAAERVISVSQLYTSDGTNISCGMWKQQSEAFRMVCRASVVPVSALLLSPMPAVTLTSSACCSRVGGIHQWLLCVSLQGHKTIT